MAETEKDKEKEKLIPIMSYYIINNHIYPNNYNTNSNSKLYISNKKKNLNIENLQNLNINIKTNTDTKFNHLSKNSSDLSHFNFLIGNKIPINPINPKLSYENNPSIKDKILLNPKKDSNSGKKSQRFKKKIKLDSNLLIKKIYKKNKLTNTNEIFCNIDNFTLNTEFRKKNKKSVITTLNSSKNSSKEKIQIHSNNKFNIININNNKAITKGNENISMRTNSSKYINNNILNKKLFKKNSAKLIDKDLFNQHNKKKKFDIFANYIKGVNNLYNINNYASNNTSCKSITTSGNNISSNKERENNLISKYLSIKNNNYGQGKQNKSVRTLSSKMKCKNRKTFLSKLHLDLNIKMPKKKIGNKSQIDLNNYLEKYQLDSPNNKVFQKTSGNYYTQKINKNSKLKEQTMKTSYKNKSSKKKNLKINIINNDNHDINRIENLYKTKINKILKDGMKEINKIKNDFVKHFTSNNSPNKNNNKKINLKKPKITSKLLDIPNNYDSNNILSTRKKKIIKKNLTGTSNLKTKTNTKKTNFELKTNRTKQLTQNNSNLKLDINSLGIPKIKTKIINLKKNKVTLDKQPTLSNTSRSTIHDSFYYLKESQKLSEYIKNYYKENKTYPETNLNFYKYGRLIGQGAFGKVNLGLNILTGRVVAIKSFNKSNLNSNAENLNKILYETNLMKKLNHPNITKILELFEDKEYILIIMEYINGGNLLSFVKKHRKVSEKTAKLLFKQIILGIKYIQEQNIVHRDIKLENILIGLNNNIKICDFGISRILSSPDELLFDQCGTPMYIAPEILLCTKNKGYKGFPVDIWSSGIVLYILLSGTLPFSFKNTSLSFEQSNETLINEDNNNNSVELQYNIINKDPKEIENISEESKDLLKKILRKNPEERISIEEILNHPWMKDIPNIDSDKNKYHLFTKAEINILSKTYIDYRNGNNEDLKENFTISNLFKEEKDNKLNKTDKNIETKSSILAPFNSINKSNDEEDDFFCDESMDDFNNDLIKLENDIIKVGNKVKEFNMLYELNNNCEVDNGIIINSRSNTLSSRSENNNMDLKKDIKNNKKLVMKDNDYNQNKEKKINKKNGKNEKNVEKILNQLENLGYNKKYVKKCIKNNILCHASAAFFLMLNYDNI